MAPSKYRHSGHDMSAIRGIISLTSNGIAYAQLQLQNGYDCFAKLSDIPAQPPHVLSDVTESVDNEEFLPVVPSNQPGSEESNGEQQEEAFETLGESHCEIDYQSDESDEEEQEFAIIFCRRPLNVPPKYAYMGAAGIREDWNIIIFEEGFSQSRIGGRDGSNACSFISAIFAYLFIKDNVFIDDGPPIFHHKAMDEIMHEAMLQGNRLYDRCQKSLPHWYCSMQEVSDHMSDVCPFVVKEELPVTLKNEHYMSTLKGQHESLLLFERKFAVIFICNEKTSVFFSDGLRIGFVDTHRHGYGGGVGGLLYDYGKNDLEIFLECIAKYNKLPENIYRNLVFIKFI